MTNVNGFQTIGLVARVWRGAAADLRRVPVGIAVAAVLLLARAATATPSDTQVAVAILNAATWLGTAQNVDGSWGTNDDDKLLYTAESVRALRAADRVNFPYQRGIEWLENHSAPNSDLAARRFAALAPHGDALAADQSTLIAGKFPLQFYSLTAGWGLSRDYSPDPLDTALVMQALSAAIPTVYSDNLDAVQSVIAAILSDDTWTIGQPELTLPFEGDVPTTVAAANVLRGCMNAGVPSCSDIATLVKLNLIQNQLTSYAYTTSLELALITGYFTPLRGEPEYSGYSVTTLGPMVGALFARQTTSGPTYGSWDSDVLTTATALHALASWIGLDAPTAPVVVPIASAGLRRAVNSSLGNPAMDAVTKGDLWRLTTLNLSYSSTGSLSDLTALANAGAGNLTTLDISGNPCLQAVPLGAFYSLFPNLSTIIEYPVGDVNRDYSVDANDQRLILAVLVDNATLSPTQSRAADIAQDGQVDARDLYWIERIILDRDVSALCHS